MEGGGAFVHSRTLPSIKPSRLVCYLPCALPRVYPRAKSVSRNLARVADSSQAGILDFELFEPQRALFCVNWLFAPARFADTQQEAAHPMEDLEEVEEDGEEGEIKGGFLGEAEMENRRTMGKAANMSWVEAVLLCPGRAEAAAIGDGEDGDGDDAAAETEVGKYAAAAAAVAFSVGQTKQRGYLA